MTFGRRLVSRLALGCLGLLAASPAYSAGLNTVRVASGFARPIFVTAAPGDTTRLFIVEQFSAGTGYVRILNLGSGTVNPTPFLIVPGVATGNEQGLLGLAFHPEYPDTPYIYVNFTRSGDGRTVIRRYTVSGNPDIADTSSRVAIMQIDQPQSNHNGGWLAFGPNDGYLYIALGDGGGANDQGTGHDALVGNGQSDATRLGKMLRIDVDSAFPFAIPASNPFFGQGFPKEEFWAKGLRNPWRNSFDRMTGDLWIADVGQDVYEEINFEADSSSGGWNYGWRKFEGFHIFNCPNPCDSTGLTRPVHEYTHGGGPFRCSVTGGYVYRGSAIPSIQGTYFFADYCSEQIWSFNLVDGVVFNFLDRTADLAPGGGLSIDQITSFGEDAKGELYICDQGGEIFKIVQTPSSTPDGSGIPGRLELGEATPNPSRGIFSFRVGLPVAGDAQVRIFDTSGRLVRALDGGPLAAGYYDRAWDGRDSRGAAVAGGVYLLRLDSAGQSQTKKLTLVR